ncbi:transcriptional repressor [soil metagenome]
MRMTDPRRRVLQALGRLGHATPEELNAAVSADGERALPPSTIYRNLESLAQVGLVRHSHVRHGAPAYHLPDHGDHLHLVCRGCGRISQAETEIATELARNLLGAHGFDADVTHTGIHGVCRDCRSDRAGSGHSPADLDQPKKDS